MRCWRSVLLLLIVLSNLVFLPVPTMAQTGLVPDCRYGEEGCGDRAYSPENYGVCELVQTFNNVLQFLLGISGIIIALVIVYAGFVMIISRGNASTIAQAKGMFSKAVVGFVIMLTAFLVVNTVMKVFVGGPGNEDLLSWQVVDCAYSNQSGTASYEIETKDNSVDALQKPTSTAVVTVISTRNGNNTLVGSAGNDILANAAGACDSSLVSKYWGSQTANAQCIIKEESVCGARPISTSDVSRVDGNVFSFGAMQINTTVHEIRGCERLGIPNMDCKAAWSGRNYSARVVNPALYSRCRAALLNNECSMINGRRIYQEAGDSWQPWSTAGTCRVR